MLLKDYLLQFREEMPNWLKIFNPQDPENIKNFLNSRLVFYPGSGFDGQAVKVFGSSHTAHCFIYVDYARRKYELETELKNKRTRFRGYSTLARINVSFSDLAPFGWVRHFLLEEMRYSPGVVKDVLNIVPYAFLEIIERNRTLDDVHGPERLAILFIYKDAYSLFDELFCQTNSSKRLFAILLQRHGFDCNGDEFDGGGLLEKLALRCKIAPEFLLIGDNTKPWMHYSKVDGVDGERSGQNHNLRCLYTRKCHRSE